MSLKGLRVIEMAGLAPAPFCGMVLADHGASVVRVNKAYYRLVTVSRHTDVMPSNINRWRCYTVPDLPDMFGRGKRSIAVNLKQPAGVDIIRKLCRNADVLIEPFRTGVMEKLGLGPQVLCKDNPGLVYARLTGFGQEGAYSHMAGHDINYIATAGRSSAHAVAVGLCNGVLSCLGEAGSNPHPPVNILADFSGGGLMCAMGILLALVDRSKSGLGQVIDSNMVHGSAYVSSFLWASRSAYLAGMGLWNRPRGENFLDGGAPYYCTYKTKDGKFVSVGALEPQFYSELLQGLGLDESDYPQIPQEGWKSIKEKFAEIFLTKTQDEWAAIFDGTDSCVAPVLDYDKTHLHDQNKQNFIPMLNGEYHPAPAPNLSRTPGTVTNTHRPKQYEHTLEVLEELGLSQEEIRRLELNKTVKLKKPSSLL